MPSNDDPNGIYLITGDNGTGKTRALSRLAHQELTLIHSKSSNYDKVICLSGTVFEKFPKPQNEATENIKNGYYYFGYKANNNMFSEITPFRMILSVLLNDDVPIERAEYAASLLNSIGFSSKFNVYFRWARNNKNKDIGKLNSLQIDLLNLVESKNFLLKIKDPINSGIVLLNKITFYKGIDEFTVTELSSGERLFTLIILSLCFSIGQNSLILFDEPENSMHPKWQEKVTRIICSIFKKFAKNSNLYIATHSPLVVSSIPNRVGFIRNFNTIEQDWHKNHFNGNNSDSILKEHFGLLSARSSDFILAFQKCLTSMAMKDNEFNQNFANLMNIGVELDLSDPLYKAYNSMIKYAEDLK
ncbi:AAA family ATPase [Aeromonas veronii]|uniref:AAA family ATPase n=1 Tax=Aeromonas TaxID=642 RepID=UPI001317F169|nr:AAA family ATPase [Aeromonas veronii]QHC07447.1 AAA family ATPase [Aeromonas veronii]